MDNKVLEKCGALWIAHSEKAGKFLKGQIELAGEKYTVMVMKNKYKEEEKHPDYTVLLQVPEKAAAIKEEFDL